MFDRLTKRRIGKRERGSGLQTACRKRAPWTAFRTGSALLIVLGMLSFMVISAVAFSIFMRQGRLPSSFLRQRILARELVKAGLAQAMSDLDESIGSAEYPSSAFTYTVSGGKWGYGTWGNYWRNRVFMGVSNSEGPYEDEEEALDNTVSTFPLEGLAYIPPPLVNTVRYWARRSPTAAWKTLDYDSGRWAYTAVNVSDYLDINALRANVMRDSCPEHRISLGYLFEDDTHASWGDVLPSKFDAAMDTLRNDSTYGPLVSLADYNLSLSSDASGKLSEIGFVSPFCEFIKSPPSGAEFYKNESQARQQKFVTDSWYPGTNTSASALFLTDDVNGQPFASVQQSLDELQKENVGNKAFLTIADHLDLCTLAALYDYVDEDNVPISLAVPTLERVPMMTGIRITPMNFEIELDSEKTEVPGAASGAMPKQDDILETWSVKSLSKLGDPKVVFSGCGVFPFKRQSGLTQTTSYDVQVRVTLFFSDGEKFEDTRLSEAEAPYHPVNGTWNAESALAATDKGWITVVGTGKANINAGALKDNQTVFSIDNVELAVDPNAASGKHVYGVKTIYKLDQDGTPVVDKKVYDASGMTDPLRCRSGSGTKPVTADMKLRLHYACWVRILDGNKTVDLVPAMVDDDYNYNGHRSTSALVSSGNYGAGDLGLDAVCGTRVPLLPICSGELLTLPAASEVEGGTAVAPVAATGADQGSLAIYCDDPRFNYAPEDWYLAPGGDVDSSTWLSKAKSRCNGNDHRQSESIFQFVSNQGFLQSMGELQFLPYLTSFKEGDSLRGNFYSAGKYNGKPFADRLGPGDLANQDFAWKTHWGFGQYADWRTGGSDPLTSDTSPYNWGIEDTNGGAAVNPYADGDLFMAALANTPYDYIVAAEDEDNEKKLEENIKLCFNARSTEAPLTWEQLEQIAERIKKNFNSGEPWDKWDDWDTDDFFGQNLQNFDDVDRKFLFSYWKPCFANTQQLFLVFVRAEPTVIGGSSMGHTPSQLGARAVALVWREPVTTIVGSTGSSSSSSSTMPHRMRVLFYHQFE